MGNGRWGAEESEQGPMAKILVVDDVPDNIKLLTYELSDQGHDIFMADNGPRALELARSEAPDVILLDIMMPGMDGLEVLRTLKSQAETRLIPVILVSAKDLDEDVIHGLDTGAQDYVTKPFSTRIVLARVRSAVRIKRMTDLLREKARVDELTGLFNQAYFEDWMKQSSERVRRYGSELSLIMLRPNNLGEVNERYGHELGDKALRTVARLVEKAARKVDIVCRFDGAELALVLPDLGSSEAVTLAHRLAQRVAETPVTFGDGEEIQLTASFGVASAAESGTEEEGLVEGASFALYQALEAGAGKVGLWKGESAELVAP